MEATMQTDTSAPQSHSLIASDRVEGTPVRRSSGEKIGTIERLMIDKLSGNVAYAVLSFGGFLGMGQKHVSNIAAELVDHQALDGRQAQRQCCLRGAQFRRLSRYGTEARSHPVGAIDLRPQPRRLSSRSHRR